VVPPLLSGVAFIPIGVGLLYFSNTVHELEIDYTDCTNFQSTDNITCYTVIKVGNVVKRVSYTFLIYVNF
jgi:hypothetical protein